MHFTRGFKHNPVFHTSEKSPRRSPASHRHALVPGQNVDVLKVFSSGGLPQSLFSHVNTPLQTPKPLTSTPP
jgi:hypothetical protein